MKKMFGQQTQPLDVGQLTSLMKSTMMFWNVLTSLETLYSNLVGSSTSSRLPEFLINFESTLTMAENFIDKQLQMASNRFDKVNKDCLTPSTIAEVSRSISALHNFYATIIPSSRSMYLASVDSLLYPLRSFTILGKRLTTEKPTLNSLLFGAQLIARLHHVAKTTRISTLAGAFIQKQRQALDESMDLLAKALVDNVKDIIKKQKDPLKRDIFEMSFKADPSNPNFLAFDSLRDIKNSEAKQVLVEKYIQYLEQSFPKYFTELNSQQDHLSGKTALLTFILNTTRTQ